MGPTQAQRVLVLTCHYPPIHSSQAVRAAKLLKYLPNEGWIPDIVCAREDPAFGLDSSLVADIPIESSVVRIPALLPKALRLPRRLEVPDHMAPWIIPAAAAAIRLAKGRRYSAVMSLSFPAASHVAALFVAWVCCLPWLADFSDPWMSNPYRVGERRDLREKLNRLLEAQVFHRAKLLGFVTPEFRDYETKFHPGVAGKWMILTNSAERTDFAGIEVTQDDTRFRIAHIGSSYGLRQPDDLLRGFASFLEAHPTADIELRFVGPSSDLDRAVKSAEPLLRDHVIILPPLARKDALREMRAADLLVLIDPSPIEPGIFLPLKLVEYLISGRPILALTVPGPSQYLVERHGAGKVVRFDDAQGIAEAIEHFYDGRRLSTDHGPCEMPELEARLVGRQVGEALNLLTGRGHPSGNLVRPDTEKPVVHR